MWVFVNRLNFMCEMTCGWNNQVPPSKVRDHVILHMKMRTSQNERTRGTEISSEHARQHLRSLVCARGVAIALQSCKCVCVVYAQMCARA